MLSENRLALISTTGVLPRGAYPVCDSRKRNYHRGHCEISCTICGSVCPTGAIVPVTKNEKRLVQLGVVNLNKEICFVHVKKIHCGARGEACPTNAIFPAEKGRVVFPEIN